jgi:hypothetical protein
MTKFLIASILVLAPLTNVFAEEDCFYRFAYRMTAQLDLVLKDFTCNEVMMSTAYDSNITERFNLDNVYKEILELNNDIIGDNKVPTCKHSCEYNDFTDYTKSTIHRIDFLKEKWCMTNPDSAVKDSEEIILSYDKLNIKANVDTYRKPKPIAQSPYTRESRPFEAKRAYTEDDYVRP